MGCGREALAAPKCFKTFDAWGAGLLNVLLGGWRIMLYRRGQDSSREQEEQRGEDRKWAQQAQRAQEWAQPGRPIRLIQEASSPDKSHGQGDSLIGKVHNP